jgi:hypothetical protein
MCSCSRTCPNRILQNGVRVKLEVFKTEKKVVFSLLYCFQESILTLSMLIRRDGHSGQLKQSCVACLYVSTLGRC